MLEYDRINKSQAIYVNKSNGWPQCIFCRYWYFLEISFRFQPNVCKRCHGLMQNVISFNHVAIVSVNPILVGGGGKNYLPPKRKT